MDELEGLEVDGAIGQAQVLALPGDHPVEPHRAREVAREFAAPGGVRPIRPSLGENLVRPVEEGERGQDRGGLAVRDMAGRTSSAHARVVHGGQVVEDQARRVHHLDRASRGEHAARIGAEDLRHHEGDDRPQALGGGEQAVRERRLDRGRAATPRQPPQRPFDLLPPVLEHRLEGGERAGSAHRAMLRPNGR